MFYRIWWSKQGNSAESWVVQPDGEPYTLVSELLIRVPLIFMPEDQAATPKAWAICYGTLTLESGKWVIK